MARNNEQTWFIFTFYYFIAILGISKIHRLFPHNGGRKSFWCFSGETGIGEKVRPEASPGLYWILELPDCRR